MSFSHVSDQLDRGFKDEHTAPPFTADSHFPWYLCLSTISSGCVRPEQLPGHFKFRHSSSLQVTFYTLHIPKVYSNLEVIQAMSWCVLLPLRENLSQYICSLQCHPRLQFGDIAANIVWTYLWDQLYSVQTLHLECCCDNFWRTTVDCALLGQSGLFSA